MNVHLTKIKRKKNQILLNKISHRFLVTIKLFNGIKHPHLTQLLNEIKTTI
jgi:hypothetical protein